MEVCTYNNKSLDDTRIGNWMQLASGRKFYPLDPLPTEIFIEDIAHALSMICRFGGHCTMFYSVAEHSYNASFEVPEEDAFAALMHDATEAYVADIIRPIKPDLQGYAEIEHRVWVAIAEKFRLPIKLPSSVKEADNAMLLAEQRDIMAPPPEPWGVPGIAAERQIQGWYPPVAKKMFLERFEELYERHMARLEAA